MQEAHKQANEGFIKRISENAAVSIKFKSQKRKRNAYRPHRGQSPGGGWLRQERYFSSAESIVTGSKKANILNVNIEKVLETVNQHISEGKEGADELVDQILDALMRRLGGTFNSVAR